MKQVSSVTFQAHVSDLEDAFVVRDVDNINTLVVVYGLYSNMPERLQLLLRVRRTAAVYQRCPICGADGPARSSKPSLPGVHVRTFEHADMCTATDAVIGQLLLTWLRQVGRYARGRRLNEPIAEPTGI